MELDEVIRGRRMCRDFSPEPVDPSVVDRCLDLARRAPSAGHTQGWAFVVLEDRATASFWEHAADPEWRAAPSLPGVVAAPVIVLPLVSRHAYLARYAEPDKAGAAGGRRRVDEWQVPYWLVDGSFATMLLLLGAAQEGLGALFFALHRPVWPLLDNLGVPEEWAPLGAVALGWPAPVRGSRASGSARRGRRPLDEIVHRGRW